MAMTSIPAMSLMHLNSRFMVGGSSGPPSEAPSSEISSVESDFSDLKSIAAGLGIIDPEEVYTERFKIDRIKLEDMIKSKFKSLAFRGWFVSDVKENCHNRFWLFVWHHWRINSCAAYRLFHVISFVAAEAYCEGLNRAEYFFATVSFNDIFNVVSMAFTLKKNIFSFSSLTVDEGKLGSCILAMSIENWSENSKRWALRGDFNYFLTGSFEIILNLNIDKIGRRFENFLKFDEF